MPPASPFDALLVQSRDLYCDRLAAAVAAMFARADEALSTLAAEASEQELQKILLEARDFARANHAGIEQRFRSRCQGEFQKRANKAKKIGQSLAEISLDDLELVDDDDLNETLKYNDLATRLRRHCEDELGALDQRVGVLLGDATLEAEDNPFGPNTLCDAFKLAGRQPESTPQIRMVMLRLFDKDAYEQILATYHELNDLLVANSILPKIRYGVSKQDSARAAAPGGKAPAEAAPEPEKDLFALLQQALGGGAAAGAGGAAGGAPGVPQLQGPELLSSLTRLQVGDVGGLADATAELGALLSGDTGLTNVLRQLKETSVGAGMGQMDSMTLDIVAMLFDQLFDDPKVPVALKGLIARLQIPILKVAIADKAFFSSRSHPARQLIDTLGRIAVRLPADFDSSNPLFGRLQGFVEELIQQFEEKVEIFDSVRERLEGLIAEDDARVAEEMESAAKQLVQAESLAVAKTVAQDEITARVGASRAPAPVVEFLAQQWIKYLMTVHARDGTASDAWNAALATIDQLLWSVEPKPTMEDRRKLAGAVPALLKAIKAGCAAAGVEDAACAAFFTQLMQCHTQAMQAPPKPPAKAPAPADGAAARGSSDAKRAPSAKAPAAPPPEESAAALLDFTVPVTINNPFGEGKVEVAAEDLDFTAGPADIAPAEAAAPAPKRSRPATIRLPASLVEGAWVEILEDRDGERFRPAKLYYVSPMKSHFLFVDRKGNKVYECSRSMLARRLGLNEVVILAGEPDASLFDRIMEGIFGKLGAVAGAQGTPA